MRYQATVGDQNFEIFVEGPEEVTVDGEQHSVDLRPIDGHTLFSLIIDNRSHELHVERREGMYYVVMYGDRFAVDVGQARLKELIAMSRRGKEHASGAVVEAPMPGLVVKVLVAAGDTVAADQGLLILEAMKMENELRSPVAGIVRSVSVAEGATVNQGDVMVVVDAPEPGDEDGEDGGASDGGAADATSTANGSQAVDGSGA
jgi:pyruvate carboxylase subunit B